MRVNASLRLCTSTSSAGKASPPKPFTEIPSPKRLPILGHTHLVASKKFQNGTFDFFNKYRQDLGNIYKLDIFGRRSLVVSFDPEDIRTILKNDGKWPFQPGFESIGYYRRTRPDLYSKSGGLLGEQGQPWYDIRSKVQQEMLRPQSAHHYITPLSEITTDFVALLGASRDSNGVLPDYTLSLLHRWGLESICRIFLDTRVGALENDAMQHGTFAERMITSSDTFINLLQKVSFSGPMFKLWPRAFKWWRDLDATGELVFKESEKVIHEAVQRILNKKATENNHEAGLLEKFIRKFGPDSHVPIVMAMDGILAGIDTTAHTAAFFMYNLAKNPDKQEILYQEIQSVLGTANNITVAHLNSMRYLKAAANESMRVMPTLIGTSRVLEVRVVLSGFEIPPNTRFMLPFQNMGLMAEHFPDPEKFRPERFLRSHTEHNTAHPFTTLPFGHGARMCIGRRFASLEIYLLIITLLQKYRIEWNVAKDLRVACSFVNRPNRPLNFTLIERK